MHDYTTIAEILVENVFEPSSLLVSIFAVGPSAILVSL